MRKSISTVRLYCVKLRYSLGEYCLTFLETTHSLVKELSEMSTTDTMVSTHLAFWNFTTAIVGTDRKPDKISPYWKTESETQPIWVKNTKYWLHNDSEVCLDSGWQVFGWPQTNHSFSTSGAPKIRPFLCIVWLSDDNFEMKKVDFKAQDIFWTHRNKIHFHYAHVRGTLYLLARWWMRTCSSMNGRMRQAPRRQTVWPENSNFLAPGSSYSLT